MELFVSSWELCNSRLGKWLSSVEKKGQLLCLQSQALTRGLCVLRLDSDSVLPFPRQWWELGWKRRSEDWGKQEWIPKHILPLDVFWPVIGSYGQNLPIKGEGRTKDLEIWICMAPISLCGWYLPGCLFFEIIHSDSEEQRTGESCSLVLNNLKEFTFQCSAGLGFQHNLFPYILLAPTTSFNVKKTWWFSGWERAGGRRGEGREMIAQHQREEIYWYSI